MRLKESQRLQNITLLLLHYPHVKHYNKLKTATLRSFRENGCASTRRHPAEEGTCPVRSARCSVIDQSGSTSVDATATAAAATQLPTRFRIFDASGSSIGEAEGGSFRVVDGMRDEE